MANAVRVSSGASAPAGKARQGVLTVNGGSSTIKCAIFRPGEPPKRVLRETVARGETAAMLDVLERHQSFAEVGAVGHRIVHGMGRVEPELVTTGLLDELRAMGPFLPEHLPGEIELIEAIRERHPDLRQIACFDTAFHHDMPRLATMIAVPRRLEAVGVRRYGFHGISCAYLMEELSRTAGAAVARGRVILAHLGGGASLTAVLDGKSVDTSMGFTPASGLMMGTRSGDVDPGLIAFLARTQGATVDGFERMASHESGLLGVSETSADMRELLACESSDVRAAEAVQLFCYQARKWVGAFAAVLDGLDTIVFAGGIGENAPAVRRRICDELDYLGVEIDVAANDANESVISSAESSVTVRVIPTDEESMIARSVFRSRRAAR
jgi:acetate kinase